MCDETYACVCTSKCNTEICKTKCNGGVAFTFANELFKNFIHPHALERFTFRKVADIIIMNQYEAKNL